MLVHELIAREVADTGTPVMFGLLGDANLFMANAFVNQNKGRFVDAAHESSAVMMAFGYACRTSGLGVATVTQGPGLANTATALLEAVRSHVPVLVITGDTAPSNTLNQQSLDQEPFVRATGAGYVLVDSPEAAGDAVRTAAARALAESRPYVLNCPTEFHWVEVGEPSPRSEADPPPAAEVSEDELEEALGVLAMARRPLVLVGKGATPPPQRDAVARLAERLGAPIATTLRARHLYSAAEGSVGVCGTVSTEVGVQAIMESDCIVTFGASLNTWTHVRNSLFEGKRIVQVDVDRARFRPEVPVTATVEGDAAAVAELMVEMLDAAELPASAFRERVTEGVIDSDLVAVTPLGDKLTFAGALSTLNQNLPHPRTIATDGGRFQGESFKYLWSTDHFREVQTTTFGAVGMGMGAAIGAALAAPDEQTVLVTGDGGFMMNGLAELHSAVRADIPLIVLICNDSSYGAEYDQFVNKGLPPDLSLFDWPDFAEVASTMGADGVTVATTADIEDAIRAVKSPTRPVVIDIRVAPQDIPEVPH